MSKLRIRALGRLIGTGLLLVFFMLPAPAALTLGIANPSPPNWVEYKDGEYRDRLATIYHRPDMTVRHVARAHYRGFGWVGDVDVFQVSAGQTCDEKACHYVMFSATLGEIPLITDCPLERVALTDMHHADGSNYFAFLFSCESSMFQVQISRDHFWINAEQRPAK